MSAAGSAGRLWRVVVGEDAYPDVVAERLPEGAVAPHDEGVGRLVRAGDDDLFGAGQLGRLGGASADGRETGRDAVPEALPGVGQGGPGARTLEQAHRQPGLELADVAADGGLRGVHLARGQREVGVPRGALEGDQGVGRRHPVRATLIHNNNSSYHVKMVK